MRRRLTVTGASETIDGVAKMSVSDEDQRQKMVRIPWNVWVCRALCKVYASAAIKCDMKSVPFRISF